MSAFLNHRTGTDIDPFVVSLNGLLRLAVTLAFIAALSATAPARAQTAWDDDSPQAGSEADWPSEVTAPQPVAPPPSASRPLTAAPKKSFWRRNPLKKEAPPPSEEKIINVGPRAHPVSAGVLLRLPRALYLDAPGDAGGAARVLPAGFYLARVTQGPDGQRRLEALLGGKLAASWALRDLGEAPAEPVMPAGPSARVQAAPSRIGARLSPDGQSLTLSIQDGGHRYETAPLPVLSDPRPELPY